MNWFRETIVSDVCRKLSSEVKYTHTLTHIFGFSRVVRLCLYAFYYSDTRTGNGVVYTKAGLAVRFRIRHLPGIIINYVLTWLFTALLLLLSK